MSNAWSPFPLPSDLQAAFHMSRLPIARTVKVRDRFKWESDDSAEPITPYSNQANLSLIWHSAMPARDSKKLLRGVKTAWGIDFSKSPRTDQGRDNCLASWSGLGSIRWFTTQAGEISGSDEFRDFLGRLHARRGKAVEQLGRAMLLRVRSVSRLAAGLGRASLYENGGLALHETYGFPILPGASLKGLARHYFLEEYPFDREGLALEPEGADPGPGWNEAAEVLFGSGAAEESGGREGALVFHDGWPLAHEDGQGWFEVDVLTPHHRRYYAGGDGDSEQREERARRERRRSGRRNDAPGEGPPPPRESDRPDPIHFPTVREDVVFEIPLALSAPARRLDPGYQRLFLETGRQVLLAALKRWGAGARTGAGYGRLEPHPND